MKKEDKKTRGKYTKRSKQTHQRHRQVRIDLASKGFLPLHDFMKLNKIKEKNNKLAPELNNSAQDKSENDENALTKDIQSCGVNTNSSTESGRSSPAESIQLLHMHSTRIKSKETSDEGNTPARDTCMQSVSGSEVESEGFLPLQDVQVHLGHHAGMVFEESSEDDKENVVQRYKRRRMSKSDTGIGLIGLDSHCRNDRVIEPLYGQEDEVYLDECIRSRRQDAGTWDEPRTTNPRVGGWLLEARGPPSPPIELDMPDAA